VAARMDHWSSRHLLAALRDAQTPPRRKPRGWLRARGLGRRRRRWEDGGDWHKRDETTSRHPSSRPRVRRAHGLGQQPPKERNDGCWDRLRRAYYAPIRGPFGQRLTAAPALESQSPVFAGQASGGHWSFEATGMLAERARP
jgi:hypothetical protein